MAATMSHQARDEYLEKMRERYARRPGRQARSALLDEFCTVTGHERKYATKLLGGQRRKTPGQTRRGRPPIYGDAEKQVIKNIWKASEQPCGKRLKITIREWLPAYEKRHGSLDDDVRRRVLTISPAQLDRLLAGEKQPFDIACENIIINEKSICDDFIKINSSGWDSRAWQSDLIDSGDILESFPPSRFIRLTIKNE